MTSMRTYRVNDIFYSLQGEGHNAGRAAVFVRLSGCNLACPFCDTDFTSYETLTAAEIVGRVQALVPAGSVRPMVVLTGGEPTLQADEALVSAFHGAGFGTVAMETNGTMLPPASIDWLTVSPKTPVAVDRCDELKCIFGPDGILCDADIEATYRYVQPCDTGDAAANAEIMARCVDFVRLNPQWRLSLQTHKLAGFK